MASDKRYLEQHGNQYRVQLKVPERLRPLIGSARLVRGLGTDSLARANVLRWPVLQEFRTRLAEAEATLKVQQGAVQSPVVQEAYQFRAELEKANREAGYADQKDDEGFVIRSGPDFIRDLAEDRLMELRETDGPITAQTFYALAVGEATPVAHYVDSWIIEAAMKPRQNTDYRRAVSKFGDWLGATKRVATVETINTKVAGQYVFDSFSSKGVNAKTANKDISCLSSYWQWLTKKGHAAGNPWRGQSLPKPVKPRGETQRAFTDAEIVKLLEGRPTALLDDFMRIAALSGMRVDEIAKLTVADVEGGKFEIRVAKTKAGERSVPIHPHLSAIVARRCAGKDADASLFPELPMPRPGSAVERSQKIVKGFGTYRRKLGVDDVVPGQRQSRIGFHSFRRWFITQASKALNAGAKGYSLYTLAEVVGHERKSMELGMTMGVYADPESDAALRACVEAVRLPA